MKYRKGILLYNGNAGREGEGILDDVIPILGDMVGDLVVYASRKQGDIEKKCSDLEGADIVFVMGGDGTLHELVNGFYRFDVSLPIGLVPAGTFNDFASTLNLPAEAGAAARALRDAEPAAYDAILNDGRIALNFWTIGLPVHNARVVERAARKSSGALSYLRPRYLFKVIANFFDPAIFRYRIRIDGRELRGRSSMILVVNGRRIGGIPIPLDDISPQDGSLNVFIVEGKGLEILVDFFGEKNSANWNRLSRFVRHYAAREIEIMRPKNERVDTDGELYQATPGKLRIVPSRFTLLRARPSD